MGNVRSTKNSVILVFSGPRAGTSTFAPSSPTRNGRCKVNKIQYKICGGGERRGGGTDAVPHEVDAGECHRGV